MSTDPAPPTNSEAPAMPPSQQAPAVSKKPSKLPKWVKLLIFGVGGFMIIAIIGFVFLFNLARDVIVASDDIIANIQSGNCGEIFDAQVTPSFQALGEKEFWEQECERIGSVLTGSVENVGIDVQGESGSNSTGTVSYAIEGNDDQTYDVTIGLEKVDGVWKMDTFNSVAQ